MRSNRIITSSALVTVAVLCAVTIAVASVTVRGASANGVDSGAPNWLLQGRSQNMTLSTTGKTATMRREIVCLDSDVENAEANPTLTLSGSCDSGNYLFVFQFTSTAVNLGVTIGHLSGFDQTNVNNFGVLICDSANNTIELCTNDPTGTHIPNVTATTTANSVTFTLPRGFPSYPAGTAQQGRGLTYFVITHQSSPITNQPSPLPIALPTVAIH